MPRKGGPPNNPKGGRPTTTALKKLHGSVNVTLAKRQYDPHPELDVSVEPPHFLNDIEQEEYRWAVLSAPRGMLKEGDHRLVIAWAKVNARYREASRQNNIPLQFECEDRLIRLSDKLGFNPTARSRLHIVPANKIIEGVVTSPWEISKTLHVQS